MATQYMPKCDTDAEEENQIGYANMERSPLLDALRKYYFYYACIPVKEQKHAEFILKKIKQLFEEYIKSTDYVFGNIYHQGSSYEGQKLGKLLKTTDNHGNIMPKRDPDAEEENQIGNENTERSSLRDALGKYYFDYACIPVDEQKRAEFILKKIEQVFEEYIKSTDYVFGNIYHQGSSYEGLKVVKPDEFDLLVPLKMSYDDWEAVEAKCGNGCTAIGYYFINKKTGGATTFDFCVVNGYIDPTSIFQEMQSLVQGAINTMNTKISGIRITLSQNRPALTLNVTYDGGREKMSVDIVPCIELAGIRYVAKRHPLAEKQNSWLPPGLNIFDQLWRRSYTRKEQAIVREMDWQYECRRTCLKILKTIRVRRGNSQLGKLSSYHLKTCMLHLNANPNIGSWHQDNVHHRFKDLLKELMRFLDDRNLPYFFNPSENLFAKYSEKTIRNILGWLRNILREPGADERIIKVLLNEEDCRDFTIDNFQVFVRTTVGNTVTIGNMKQTTRVKELKEEIRKRFGTPPSQQLLVFAGKNLDDQNNMKYYGIGNESTIHMTGRLRGG